MNVIIYSNVGDEHERTLVVRSSWLKLWTIDFFEMSEWKIEKLFFCLQNMFNHEWIKFIFAVQNFAAECKMDIQKVVYKSMCSCERKLTIV